MAVEKVTRTLKNEKKVIRYRARVFVHNQRIGSAYFDTRGAAETWHDQIRKKYLSGEQTFDWKFRELFELYLKERRYPVIRLSTQQTLELRSRYFRECPLDDVKMSDFNADTVDRWLNWLLNHETASNPGRKNFEKELRILTAVLNWFKETHNPSFVVPILKRHRSKIRYKPVAPRRPDYFMRPDEIRAWIDYLKKHRTNPTYWRLAMFMVLCGTRIGEACALRWSDIDFKFGTANITSTVIWDRYTKKVLGTANTKTEGSVRIVPLATTLLDVLSEARKEANSVFVFPDKEGNILKYNAIQSAFNKAFKALNLPWTSTHICRHSNATWMLAATDNNTGVQANLGHKSAKQTQEYAKVVAMLKRDLSEKTAEIIGFSAPPQNPPHDISDQGKSVVLLEGYVNTGGPRGGRMIDL